MKTHSSILAWRIPWTGEPGRLQSIGSYRVGQDWSNLVCMHALVVEFDSSSHFQEREARNRNPSGIFREARLGTEIPLEFLRSSFLPLLAIERNWDSQTNSALPGKILAPPQTDEPQWQLTWDFPGGSVLKNLPADAGDARDAGLTPGSGRSPGGRRDSPLQYLAWEVPWTEEPGGLQSMGSQRAGHDGWLQSQTWLSTHAGWQLNSKYVLLYFLGENSGSGGIEYQKRKAESLHCSLNYLTTELPFPLT